jgi:hypothetical protein
MFSPRQNIVFSISIRLFDYYMKVFNWLFFLIHLFKCSYGFVEGWSLPQQDGVLKVEGTICEEDVGH